MTLSAVRSPAGISAAAGHQGDALLVEDLSKDFGNDRDSVRAVDGVTFSVRDGTFLTLLGPSGCGKTTTLRCVAGLERADGGRIALDGRVVSDPAAKTFVPAHRRNIGMVFQSYAVWPHMTVFENVAYPLRVGPEKVSRRDLDTRVNEALGMVELTDYASRMATQLSGGQQQRLALARALVRRPKLLLLDEPLSNLDAKLREQMRFVVRNLQRRLGLAALYVTHDQTEALSMSDRIAVMSKGRIVQEGTPQQIYNNPADHFVADFVGSMNFIEGSVAAMLSAGRMTVLTPAGPLDVASVPGAASGQRVMLAVRPENIKLHLEDPGAANVIVGTIEQEMFLGDSLDYRIRVGDSFFSVRQPVRFSVATEASVWLELSPDGCTVLQS